MKQNEIKNSDQSTFPLDPDHNSKYTEYAGLTKREYFAGLAMVGLLSNSGQVQTFAGNRPEPVPSYVAKTAIDLADELLKQLEKPQS